MNTKLGSTKIIFRQVCTNIYGTFNIILLYNFIKSAIQTKKGQMSWKKNWTPSLRSTEESIVNQNGFGVLSNLYITDFLWNKKNKF